MKTPQPADVNLAKKKKKKKKRRKGGQDHQEGEKTGKGMGLYTNSPDLACPLRGGEGKCEGRKKENIRAF